MNIPKIILIRWSKLLVFNCLKVIRMNIRLTNIIILEAMIMDTRNKFTGLIQINVQTFVQLSDISYFT